MPLLNTPGGVEIAYKTAGLRTNPPVVLVHGLGAQLIGWHPQLVQRLVDVGHHVVRFDNRDVGLSSKFPGVGYTLDDMADDLIGVLDALRLDSAHMVGQSLGGMVAQLAALDHPQRVRSLGLIYTTATTRHMGGLHALEDRTHLPIAQDRRAAVEQFLENEAVSASPAYPQDEQWLRELGGAMYDRCYDPDGPNRQFAAMLNAPDRTHRLGAISVPTTIIHGDSDRLIDPAGGRALHAGIPGSALTVYKGVGHELPRDLWDHTVELLSKNIQRGENAHHAE